MDKFTINAGELTKAVKLAASIVERRNTIPILSNVLLTASGDGLCVSATDLDMQMDATAKLAAPIKSTIAFTVEPRALLAALVTLPREWPVTVEYRDGAAHIAWQWGEMRLLTLPASDFPAMKAGKALAGFEIPEGGLKPLLDVRTCVSTEETRYYLNGVYLDRDGDNVMLVATDGHRLCAAKTDWVAPRGDESGAERFTRIVPRKVVDMWAAHFKRSAHRYEFYGVDGGTEMYSRLVGEGLTLTSKNIDGTFPEWRRVVPKNRERAVTFSRNALMQALKSAIAFNRATGRTRSYETVIAVDGERGSIQARYDGQEMALDVGAARGPSDFDFGCKAPYLLNAIQRLTTDEIRLTQSGDGDPVCVLGDEHLTQVVMPLRTSFTPARKNTAQKAAA